MSHHHSLSERGARQAENPARVDLEIFAEAAENAYCPEENPTGAFPLNIAENGLSAPIIRQKLTEILQQRKLPDWVMKYTDSTGHPEVRSEIARFMEDLLCQCPVQPDTLALSAGASAVIELSGFVLADAGDVVVIPAPSYPVYTKDLGTKSGMERYDLQTHYDLQEIGDRAPVSPEMLDRVLADLKRQKKRFRILLITSPDNPTGCRYTEQQLRQLADWCLSHRVHLLVNEIYGLSLIDPRSTSIREQYTDQGSYVSFARIMAEAQSDYLHLWYSFSKDFAMSGLRVGLLHSLNEALLRGYGNANLPHLVSNLAQWVVMEMLKDRAFLRSYIQTNQSLLQKSYQLVIDTLEEKQVPYIPSRGSLFVWADLSKYLEENNERGEEQLWMDIYRGSGVLLTPGEGFGHRKKGLFRIVFTALPFEHLRVAMDRLGTYLDRR